MTKRFLFLATTLLAAPLVAHQAAAQTPLAATLQADRTTVQQDEQLLLNVKSQLRTDEAAGNNAAVAADRTALRLAQMKVAADTGKLHQDSQSILQPDVATLTAALTQLYGDQVANNSGAIAADQANVAAAQQQLSADREAVFGGLQTDKDHWHRRQ